MQCHLAISPEGCSWRQSFPKSMAKLFGPLFSTATSGQTGNIVAVILGWQDFNSLREHLTSEFLCCGELWAGPAWTLQCAQIFSRGCDNRVHLKWLGHQFPLNFRKHWKNTSELKEISNPHQMLQGLEQLISIFQSFFGLWVSCADSLQNRSRSATCPRTGASQIPFKEHSHFQ